MLWIVLTSFEKGIYAEEVYLSSVARDRDLPVSYYWGKEGFAHFLEELFAE